MSSNPSAPGVKRRIVDLYSHVSPGSPRDDDEIGEDGNTYVNASTYVPEVVFQGVRYEPKGFGVRQPNPNRSDPFSEPRDDVADDWIWNKQGCYPWLWRANYLHHARTYRADEPVWLASGHKDGKTMLRHDPMLIVTTNEGGEKLWGTEHAEQLRGFKVVHAVLDRDGVGRSRGRRIVETLRGVVPKVVLFEAVEGKDITDHLDAGFKLSDLVELSRHESPVARMRPEATPEFLLERALRVRVENDSRHDGALDLVTQARDHRYTREDATDVMALYVQQVEHDKDGDGFSFEEAMQVFNSAWDTPARKPVFSMPGEPVYGEAGDRPYTDLGNGERLVDRHGESLRYVHATKSWHVWDGRRWKRDSSGEVMRLAAETIRDFAHAAADEPDEHKRKSMRAHVARSEGAPKLRAMVELASSILPVPVEADAFDADPMVLNLRNGQLHLFGRQLSAHDPRGMHSKLAPLTYDTTARCPAWDAFLRRIMPNEEDRRYLQRAVGYSLTGVVSEHVLFLLYGSGANGKSTFLEAIRGMLGGYAHVASSDLFLAKRPGAIPLEAAGLKGRRFVVTNETDDGKQFAESTTKNLTGGDVITARRLYGDYFEFAPTHKLWLGTNHRPVVQGTDEAIWRRIVLIPFTVTIPRAERDPRLAATLRKEMSGILNWAVKGCYEWQQIGLGQSTNIRAASEAYREESDVFGDFLDECCEVGATESGTHASLYSAYRLWAVDNGYKPMSSKAFAGKLTERGFLKRKIGDETYRTGLKVRGMSSDGKLRLVR